MIRKLFSMACLCAALAATAGAQYVKVDPKTQGYGSDVFYGATFDRSHLVTIKAKIRGISVTPALRADQAADVALLVSPFEMAKDRYGKERMVFLDGYLSVELGPHWFVKSQSAKLHVNDYVEIVGSNMSMDGRPVVIAQTVRHGHAILALHRLSGEPYWYAFRSATDAKSAPEQPTAASKPSDQGQQASTQVGPYGSQMGPSTIFGPSFSLTSGPFLFGQSGLVGSSPLSPVGGPPVVVMGNPWFGGANGFPFFRF